MSNIVADPIGSRLHACGVRRIFGYPGDGIGGLIGAMARIDAKIEFVPARHEELAAFMACAHAKFAGEVGVCLATSGPGAIHLLNGLYDAKMDHQPWWRSSASRRAPRWMATTSRKSTRTASSRTSPPRTSADGHGARAGSTLGRPRGPHRARPAKRHLPHRS